MLKIGDKVTVLFPEGEANCQAEIVDKSTSTAADWVAEITVGNGSRFGTVGTRNHYRDQDLALQPGEPGTPDQTGRGTVLAPVAPERPWFHDELYLDNMVQGWIDNLDNSLQLHARAMDRLSDALENFNK